MVGLRGRIVKAGEDVRGLQRGEVLKDLGLRNARGKQIEHVFDANAHAANAGTSTALTRIEGNAVDHGREHTRWNGHGKEDIGEEEKRNFFSRGGAESAEGRRLDFLRVLRGSA